MYLICFYKVKKNLSVDVLLYFTQARISRQKKKNYNKYTHITLINFIQYYWDISNLKMIFAGFLYRVKQSPHLKMSLNFNLV